LCKKLTALGLGITYEQLTSDLTGVNYFSIQTMLKKGGQKIRPILSLAF
jgi:capsid protein